jgi:hypothetical protein
MTVFVSSQQVQIFAPLQYVAQWRSGRSWLSVSEPKNSFDEACKALIKWQRGYKKPSKGRIVVQGIISTQSYSRNGK